LPVIPASHSARQANAKAQQTSATCGRISQQELPLASPDLCSAKMLRDICPLGLKTYSTTWTDWVTATRQDYLARRKSAQHTGENGFSGWPTPAAHEPRLGYQNRNNGKKGSQKSLTTVVIEAGQPVQGNPSTDGKNRERWATPLENDHWVTNQPRKDNRQEQLPQMVQKWATPTAASAEKPQGPNSKQVGLSNQAKWATPEAQNQTGCQTRHGQTFPRLGTQTNGKLNPNWVEQLMGLDPGRTQLPTEWTG
tara:strand:+ start:71 stop:826 length:756 start_codon:yes stop_codon:yes gene_type:complete